VNFDVTDAAEQGWLEVLADKAQKDDTFFRECTPGYYNNEGKNERDSIFLSNYGGGPFEYMDVLRGWISDDTAVERDLALTEAV
jgi:cyclohexanone monooxygenase